MKKILTLFIGVTLVIFTGCSDKRKGEPTVLVFTKTAGYVHQSIPKGVAAIKKLGLENNFKVDTTSISSNFNDDNLKMYSAVIFLNTTEDVLNSNEETAFERYIQSGGGFVGIHAATDTEYDWNWYAKLVGAQFLSHPHNQEANFIIKDKNFAATSFFTDSIWTRTDELYNFKKMNPDVNVILTIDESTYTGGANGAYHPMSWYHEYDGGRSFYTALGHTDESFEEENYLEHLLGGIQYAIGENNKLKYKNATSEYAPDPLRFSKNNLNLGGFFEPTEMTILPNLDVLIAQRRGEIMYYDHETEELSQVALLDVYHKTSTPGVNAEEGIMGLQKDPNFATNNWVYVFYSPAGDEWVNRLSRFTFKDGVFDVDSEVKVLDVDSQREICCHTGGSIAFGGDGLLYVSTGDNTTPFDEKGAKYTTNGYAPLNDEPGKDQFDARRSSGNTNDLRGKILRIRVNDDGSYDIPEGNLFPIGIEKTRPEIYTMGHRNPYRISVDPKNGYLYWGDVGPDANDDDFQNRGPRGHDEFGQAKTAGNYGWPLFVGDNKPYFDYDYATGISGKLFDPENPINDSRNNTGLNELPPAQSAMIWYPYNKSTEFPQVGTGGRNAMAGPAYYNDMFPKETSLPIYYNEKVIIYEWMRGWMKAVSLFPNGDFNKMEPFAPTIKLNNLIDMEVAPNGKIYLLEYGSGWFQQNDDSGLSVIEFNSGNMSPIIGELEVNKTSGVLPLSVNLAIKASDVESDNLTYTWNLGNGDTIETIEPLLQYTFNEGGDFKIQVSVTDEDGAIVQSGVVGVVAGNEQPIVTIDLLSGNNSFFIHGKEIGYKVSVQDPKSSTDVDLSNVYVSVDYLDGMDEVAMDQGHKEVASSVMGKSLTQSMDCRACHKENSKSIGPSYMDVSEKYKDDENATNYLQNKIVSGGGGVWGETVMAAHPDISKNDLRQITDYILSLKGNSEKKSLPIEGIIIPEKTKPGKSMVIRASYTDAGEGDAISLTGTSRKVLSSNMVSLGGNIEAEGFEPFEYDGMPVLTFPNVKGWFGIKNIDLNGLKSATIMAGWQGDLPMGLSFEAHLDSPDGKLIGSGNMAKPVAGQNRGAIPIKLDFESDGNLHNIYFTYVSQNSTKSVEGALIMVQFN